MGTVWAARDVSRASKIVAVKTMLPALCSDPRFERMFLAESRIASRIQHPNVCAVLDQGEHNGVLYYVMEWVDGDALVALLGGSSTRPEGRPLPWPVAVRIVVEAAQGLHAAHELRDERGALIGVVHRDVSPHNILLTRGGTVKIADFGVAKAATLTDNPTTSTGHIKGKIHFMAPEQVYGDELDRRTDVFALGIVLYQLSTGAHPFAGGHDLAVMSRIVSPAQVTPPSRLDPSYPKDLEAVVMRALAKRQEDRFSSMAELATALETVEARLAAPSEEVTAFIANGLAERAQKRALLIEQALRAVEARDRTDTSAPEGGMTRTYRRRGQTLAAGAALLAAGALLGATSLFWLRGAGPAPAGASVNGSDGRAGVETPPVASPWTLDVPAVASGGHEAEHMAGGGDAGARDAGDGGAPDAGAGGRPGSRSTLPDGGAGAGGPGKAKFRDPGF